MALLPSIAVLKSFRVILLVAKCLSVWVICHLQTLNKQKLWMKKNKEDAESEEYRPKTGPGPNTPKPNKPKPKFKADKKAVDHAWDDHKPGSQYDKDGKDQNIWHDTKTSRERLEKLLAEAQEQGKGVETPRNPTDPRAGKYIDYNTHDESNPTGRNGQTGIRIVVDGNGKMITAFPYPHVDGN